MTAQAAMMGQGEADPDETPLPALREELAISEAADDAGWAGGYLIHDPVRNAYFRISHLALRALACWPAGTVGAVRACLKKRFGIEATVEDILELAAFLEANALVREPMQGWQKIWQVARATRGGALKWLLHHYLFFRIPLVRPQRFLNATFPYVRWLGSRAGLMLWTFIFLLGAWLTLKQWEEFKATFLGFFSMKGLFLYGLTIIVVKVAHELGHAYIATRYRARVPSMGIAFLVMTPMFYTDVTDAWKLRNRRARMLIGLGGVLTELALAGVALFLWAILPEGPARTAAYFVATTSLLTTLLVNASPFMRFDGYHVLVDILRMHNLRPRAFALLQWRLRGMVLGLKEPPPEELPPRMRRIVLVYAVATAIYWFFLFIGIALIVYHAFPKVLGIVLAGVEIGWFIVLPVARMLKDWWERREEVMRHGKPKRLLIGGGLALLALFAPVWRSASVPAVLLPAAEQEVFAPEPARIAALLVKPGQRVRRGQVLAELTSEELDYEWRKTQTKLALVERRLARMVASREDLRLIDVLKRERQQLRTALKGLRKRKTRLALVAETDGVVRRMQPGLRPGVWVNPRTMLLRVVAARARKVAALAPETVVGRLRAGAEGVFVPDDPGAGKLKVRLAEIGVARREGRDILYLSSVHGGPVAARRDPQSGGVHTRVGMFPLTLLPVRAGRGTDAAAEDARAASAARGNDEAGRVTGSDATGGHAAGNGIAGNEGAASIDRSGNAAGGRGVADNDDDAAVPCVMACRGRVVLEATAESLAGRLARRVVSVFLRESGF